MKQRSENRVTAAMLLITIGIVYGDIGTSPMYVMKSILEGNGGIGQVNEEFILGALSLVIWTVTLITTIKHVVIAMKANNQGEGGIFALYSLVKDCGKWLILPAMVGGAAILADGVLTPAVTVTTAVEGLRSIPSLNAFLGDSQLRVIIITLLIISALFFVQRAGTSSIGKAFGPVMLVWFLFLGVVGVWNMRGSLYILKAFNPVYAVKVLFSDYNKAGFMILGSVFLSTTGAEALYSDMGHVGEKSIYLSWPLVKLCLILNYLGQGAWILANTGSSALQDIADMNPFFYMLPDGLRPVAVLLGAAAAVIASQALITGSFSLVSEAIHLDLLPHMQISYPSETKQQLYIPLVNNILWVGCAAVVLYFRSGARMENAYGLAITISMIATTVLLAVYLIECRKQLLTGAATALLFGLIETVFFVSSLGKFARGGYVSVILASLILVVMVIWYRGTQVENMQRIGLNLKDYLEHIGRLREDESIPKICDNLIYITKGQDDETIDRDTLYSILDRDPKRAVAYWFISVHVLTEPNEAYYTVESFDTDYIFRIHIYLGFKVPPRVNLYLRRIVSDLMAAGDLPPQSRVHSVYGPSPVGTFKFVAIRKLAVADTGLSGFDSSVMRAKYRIRSATAGPVQWYGLETSQIIYEDVPLFISGKNETGDFSRREKAQTT